MASSPTTSWQIDAGKVETVSDLIFLGSKISVDGDWKAMTNLNSVLKSRDSTLLTKVCIVKVKVFPKTSSNVLMWELNHKVSWAPKNWCFQTVVLGKTLVSPLDCREIQPVNPKGNQSWIFIGRTDAKAETPIFWPPDVKCLLIGKDPDTGKDWRQEEKGTTEDEMVGWYYWLNGHEFEQTLGESDGQESLACCSPWGRRESSTTEWPEGLQLLPLQWAHPRQGCGHAAGSQWQKGRDAAGDRPALIGTSCVWTTISKNAQATSRSIRHMIWKNKYHPDLHMATIPRARAILCHQKPVMVKRKWTHPTKKLLNHLSPPQSNKAVCQLTLLK